MAKLNVNGNDIKVDADPNMPLLYALRDLAGLTGTKFGCGVGQCGACTIHIDGRPTRSCITPVSVAQGKQLTTIEGLAKNGQPSAVQQAWLDHKVPQCGYCQSGQMMSATALLNENAAPSDDDINTFMQGNICRCGTYERIRAAIKDAAAKQAAANKNDSQTTAKSGAKQEASA